ncbi:hypothetical protein [Microvirga roseola]|uniref:hypothetical protein n=1 Tax=Microvirga roseola TaxID=2883126 RepID=UPI001E49BC4E|nr:hypothetical protein [Microvirga roseola]
MHTRIALFIAGLTLLPVTAEAAACRLDQATFRPKFSSHAYVLRGGQDGDIQIFDLTIQKTNETFRFKVTADERTGEGVLTSVLDGAGRTPEITTGFRLLDETGVRTASPGKVGHLSFLDLGRAFIKFRLRERPQPEPYTSPPSGVWEMTECRAGRGILFAFTPTY